MPAPSKIADLQNQYDDDRVLKRYLQHALPPDVLREAEDELHQLGELSGGELFDLQLSDRSRRPELTQWDASGTRIDHIDVTDVWSRAHEVAAEFGLVATPYEQQHSVYSRILQFAKAYLFIPSTDMFGFLLATTDGAARTILTSGRDEVQSEALPHLTSRDPEQMWTAGHWSTEQSGTSVDTVARRDDDGTWRLTGRKWFTSSSVANVALVLASTGNPDANGTTDADGSPGLFYLPIRTEPGQTSPHDGIRVNRLKESMGARKIPVAEIELDGARALPVTQEPKFGTHHLRETNELAMLWSSMTAIGYMRRGLALARDYGQQRTTSGTPIIEMPLHYDTMASMQATFEGAFHLSFRVAELVGKQEGGTLSDSERHLLRVLSPMTKLLTARQAVSVVGDVMEAFGGAGYVEDSGIPMLLRDVYSLPVWRGTTNVLALRTLRMLRSDGRLQALKTEFTRCTEAVEEPALEQAVKTARDAFRSALEWLANALDEGRETLEAGARRFVMTIGRALELALLARHAQWALSHEGSRATAVVEHFATQGIDEIAPRRHYDAYRLARDLSSQSLFQM